MLRLYMDEHVRRAVTRALRMRGVDVLTAQEDGMEGTPDPELLQRASELGRVLFTQDDDFLVEATRRQRAGDSFAGVLYAHQDVPVRVCIDHLELIAVACEPGEYQDRVEYLPL
jgi:predicted nuclease of predicted toxin-antitoxin system